jgi:hypothetical protein
MRKGFTSFFLFLLLGVLHSQNYTLTITEINYHPDSSTNCRDWFELHNYGSSAISIGNWRIRDKSPANLFLVPSQVSIPAGGYLVLVRDTVRFDQFYNGVPRVGNFPFGLDNSWDSIRIYDAQLQPVILMKYVDSIPWPKGADGYGRTLELQQVGLDLNDPTSWRTGCVMGSPGGPRVACTNERLIVSEINYSSDPSDDAEDWIEIRNLDNVAKDLSGYRFRDRRDTNEVFTFPPNTSIAANGFLVIYRDLVKFNQQHPGIANKIGPFGFGLSSNGDAVRIYNASDHVIWSVRYNTSAPWPTEANGMGYTLEGARTIDYDRDVNSWQNWGFGCKGGSPGYLVPASCFVGTEDMEAFSVRDYAYPNPADSHLYPGNSDTRILQLSDLSGRILSIPILKRGVGLPVSHFPDGFYLVWQEDGLGNRFFEKILIRH